MCAIIVKILLSSWSPGTILEYFFFDKVVSECRIPKRQSENKSVKAYFGTSICESRFELQRVLFPGVEEIQVGFATRGPSVIASFSLVHPRESMTENWAVLFRELWKISPLTLCNLSRQNCPRFCNYLKHQLEMTMTHCSSQLQGVEWVFRKNVVWIMIYFLDCLLAPNRWSVLP